MNIKLCPAPVAAGLADVDRLVSSYCRTWNEPDPDRRLRRLRSIWHDNATFDNAAAHVSGVGEMHAHIGASCTWRGGWRFVVVDATAHGRHVHMTWRFVDPTGRERLAGHDVGEFAADQRFERIVSFWRTGVAE